MRFESNIDARTHLCGYDLNLTYPQVGGHFPTLKYIPPEQPAREGLSQKKTLIRNAMKKDAELARRELDLQAVRRAWTEAGEHLLTKRDLSGRANGTIDPFYGCDLFDELIDYAVNFSLPWSKSAALVVSVSAAE